MPGTPPITAHPVLHVTGAKTRAFHVLTTVCFHTSTGCPVADPVGKAGGAGFGLLLGWVTKCHIGIAVLP